MKNFKLFMKAIDEEMSEEIALIIFFSIMGFGMWLCYMYPIILLILSMFGIYLIMVEIAQSFSKWSKKVMKKYKQLKGENNGKI